MSTVIGLIGAAGSGKSSVALRLVERFRFSEYSFAEPLKQLCAEQFGWDYHKLNDLGYKEETIRLYPGGFGTTRREILQYIGTDVFRSMNPNHWVDLARRRLVGQQLNPGLVFADVRFQNEIGLIRELGGYIVRVIKTGGEGTDASAHVSETELSEYCEDAQLVAEAGNMTQLYAATHDVVARIADQEKYLKGRG